MQDPEIRPLFENQEDLEICFLHHLPAGISIVTYLCEGGKTRSVNIYSPRLAEGKKTRVTREELLALTRDFHPSIRAIVQHAPETDVHAHSLLIRDPLLNYVRGKAVVIGDAAHTMKPVSLATATYKPSLTQEQHQGQGASIAMESAGCLEVLFTGASKDDVPSRLRQFEKLRLGRCGPVHVFSNMPLGPQGYPWMLEKIRPFWDETRPLPPPGSRPLSEPFREFIFGYDVFAETRKALEEAQKDCRLNGTTVNDVSHEKETVNGVV